MRANTIHSADKEIELFYAFDIHCNAFVPFFFIIFVIQVLFLIVRKVVYLAAISAVQIIRCDHIRQSDLCAGTFTLLLYDFQRIFR